jgi:hypothetical protein
MNEQPKGQQITAVVLIGLGILFLLGQIFQFSFWGTIWPFFVIVPGAAFLYAAVNGDRKSTGLIFPGAIITGTGVILLYQNITGHWESWAYAWILYPVFVGLALMFEGGRKDNPNTYKTGRGMVYWGGLAFLLVAALFELTIFNRSGFLSNILLPLLLIGAGAVMLFRGNLNLPGLNSDKDKRKHDETPVFTGARVVNVPAYRANGHAPEVSSELQRKIDQALAEDDQPDDEPLA